MAGSEQPIPLPEYRVAVRRPQRPRPQRGARRRYGYRRRHTPHYYLALTGLSCAAAVCGLSAAAYLSRSILLAEVTFGAVAVTALVIVATSVWGIFTLVTGPVPNHRLKYLVPHGAVGVLSPLVYSLNIPLALDGLGRPVGAWLVAGSALGFSLLVVQFALGKAVAHRAPLRLVKSE